MTQETYTPTLKIIKDVFGLNGLSSEMEKKLENAINQHVAEVIGEDDNSPCLDHENCDVVDSFQKKLNELRARQRKRAGL